MVKNRRGSVMVVVMLYTMVLILLGVSILGAAAIEYRMEAAYRNRVKAYYLAEAGAEKAIFHIARLDVINPDTLEGSLWEMGKDDIRLLGPGDKGDFSVTVERAGLFDVVFMGDEEDIRVHKKIYDIALMATAHYNTIPATIQVHMLVEDYRQDDGKNKVQVYHWRQLGRVVDEN